jgi:transcription initiation factor TFIIIB Brf1 subunit/transcription initiation factor TFIIB
MGWNEIDKVVDSGLVTELCDLKCPECGKTALKMRYDPKYQAVDIVCKNCECVTTLTQVAEKPNIIGISERTASE